MGAGRDRVPAALSAILDDDDGLFACRLAARRRPAWSRPADPERMLLSGRERVHRRGRRIDPAGSRRGCCRPGQDATTAAERAWPAATDRAGRRSLSGTGRNDRARNRRRARPARSRLAGVLSEPGRPARMDWPGDRRRDPARRRRRRAAGGGADLVCLGAFGDAGRARPRLSPDRRRERCAGLSPSATVGADPGFIAALARSGSRCGTRLTLDGLPGSAPVAAHWPEFGLEHLARRPLSLDQIGSHRRGRRLDGGAALPAAAVRLSRDGAGRLGPVARPSRSWSAACCTGS